MAAFPSVGRETGRPDCPPPPARLPASDGFELVSEGGIVLSVVEVVETPPSEIPSAPAAAAAARSLDAPSGLGNCGGVFHTFMTFLEGIFLHEKGVSLILFPDSLKKILLMILHPGTSSHNLYNMNPL